MIRSRPSRLGSGGGDKGNRAGVMWYLLFLRNVDQENFMMFHTDMEGPHSDEA